MQQDTLFGEINQPLTQNLYIYCLNNGVNLRDPSGNSSIADLQAQYDRAQRAGAGQSVLDGIKSAMESKRKADSKPTPKPTTKPPKPKPPTKPTPPKSDGGSLTPQDISELLDEGSIIGGCLDEFERAGNLDDNQKQIYEALKKRQDEIFKLMEGFVKANPNLSENDWLKIYFPATQMTDAELLDKLQTAFDIAGVIPILGEGFDLTNGIISAIRGDWVMAGLSIGSMIPIAGDIAGKGGKAAIKYGDNVVDAIKGVKPKNIKIDIGKQNKHIPGTNNFKVELANGKNKSILTADPQDLLDNFAGTGNIIPGTTKERVAFGRIIGQYYDANLGKYIDTTNGLIHYNSKGTAHIVPATPDRWRY